MVDTNVGEEWRTIEGYEGFYEVSSLGRVRRTRTGPRTRVGLIIQGYSPRGYRSVRLSRENKIKAFQVHRLVCAAFHGDQKHLQVNHKNGVRDDNRAANLEWVTGSENQQHAVRELNPHRNLGSANASARLTEEMVVEMRSLYAQGWSRDRLSERFKIKPKSVWETVTRRNWRHVP